MRPSLLVANFPPPGSSKPKQYGAAAVEDLTPVGKDDFRGGAEGHTGCGNLGWRDFSLTTCGRIVPTLSGEDFARKVLAARVPGRSTPSVWQAVYKLCKNRTQMICELRPLSLTKLAFLIKRQRLKHARIGRAESVLLRARQCLWGSVSSHAPMVSHGGIAR